MSDKKYQFLVSVVGIDGAKALMKAAERAEELDQAIFPRTILAWLEAVAPLGYDGEIPGVYVPFAFSKNENGFDGSIAVNGELHRFKAASINHLAGCVAVALGLDHERVSPLAKNEQLAKLGKSIDLLVKSQLVKTSLQKMAATHHWDTPEFKNWFNGSKVVSSEGKPLVVYHGTAPSSYRFNPQSSGSVDFQGEDFHQFNTPSYFSSNPEYAGEFAQAQANIRALGNGARLMPVHLSIKNPYDARGDKGYWQTLRHNTKSEVERLKSLGHDGVIMHEVPDRHPMASDIWVAFHPHQIKSAVGNQGTYNTNDPSISKAAVKPNKPTSLPGKAAAPIKPLEPLAPTPIQPKTQTQAPVGAVGTASATKLPKLPKVSATPKKTASITKSESLKRCAHCTRPQFSADKFKGCFCFNALAKSVKTTATPTGFTLEFGAAWDQDAILSLLETFKGK